MTCKNIGHVISKLRIEKLYQSFHCSQYTHSIINDSCTTKAALNWSWFDIMKYNNGHIQNSSAKVCQSCVLFVRFPWNYGT